MYIKCPSCNTSFVVTPEQIGPKGRRVRCSKCSHGWFVEALSSEPLILKQDEVSPIVPDRVGVQSGFSPGVNLPALLPINIPLYLYILPAILSVAVIFSFMVLFQDKLSFLGLAGTSDALSIHDIDIDYNRHGGTIVANYKIINSSNSFVPVPLIRIRLLDHDRRVLKTHVTSNPNVDLSPKQYVTIRTNFAEAPPNVEFIDVALGSRLDFVLR
ncbi:MAG: hypothetical protein RLZZ59_578 [Pseudomonadota bacterium]|jgi:predicted Zn finger-like uncharacterized protein